MGGIWPGERPIGIDTNVLLRFIVRDHPDEFAAARSFMRSLTRERPGFISHVTLVELAWVMRRTYKRTRRDVLAALGVLVRNPALEFEDGEAVLQAIDMATNEGADFPDALIACSMRLFDVAETVTFDRRAADRLGWRQLAD